MTTNITVSLIAISLYHTAFIVKITEILNALAFGLFLEFVMLIKKTQGGSRLAKVWSFLREDLKISITAI